MSKAYSMKVVSVRSLWVSVWVGLMPLACCTTALAAGTGYWLRFDDLRMPRPRSDESGPQPKAKDSPSSEKANGAPARPDAVAPEPTAEAADNPLRIGGNFKILGAYSRTGDAENKPYTQLLGRLRLKVDYRFLPSLEAKIEHDTEIMTGSYVATDYFQARKSDTVSQYGGDGSTWADRRHLYGTQRLFRASMKWTSDFADVTVGRQRIPLGTGRFWSALDMLNPIDPLQVERDEFTGVDAALIQRGIGALSTASLIYAPDAERISDRWVTQYRTHVNEGDVTLTYGKYWADHVTGVDFATQLGSVGLRGEAAYTRPKIGNPYRKALLGFEYSFENTLAFSAEAYYSDRSASDRIAQWAENQQLSRVQPPGKAYVGLAIGYDFTPLLKASTYILNNLKDGSGVVYPTLMYSFSEDINLMGGAQFFFGGLDSEYGLRRNSYYARFQKFF